MSLIDKIRRSAKAKETAPQSEKRVETLGILAEETEKTHALSAPAKRVLPPVDPIENARVMREARMAVLGRVQRNARAGVASVGPTTVVSPSDHHESPRVAGSTNVKRVV